VIRVPSGRRAGLAVVLDAGLSPRDDPRPLVVTEQRWAGRLSPADFPVTAEVLGRVRLGRHVPYRSPQTRRDLASSIRALGLPSAPPRRRKDRSADEPDPQIERLRRDLRAHPCHDCPDREAHMRWAERHGRLERENADLRRRTEGRTGSLGRRFDRICSMLDQRGYLAGDSTTELGKQLARIWSESDLVVAECLRAGIWDALDPAELAAVVSALVYEPRRDALMPGRPVTAAATDALTATMRVWRGIVDDEAALGLEPSREPQPALAAALFSWAGGGRLDQALDAAADSGADLSAGDFVRWCKQVLDLLDQLASVPGGRDGAVEEVARAASRAIRRGVVAQSMSV
jgi:ATP-dependent RNA helicase HelY